MTIRQLLSAKLPMSKHNVQTTESQTADSQENESQKTVATASVITEAWVDVFIHGDTSGGNWATALQAGDIIRSKREFPEKIAHLRTGQALLIADETSMPTVARLLETWENPIAPLVLCITQAKADQAYFDEVNLSPDIKDSVTVLQLITGNGYRGADLAALIDTYIGDYLTYNPLTIEKVWGALEASAVKALRPMLRERFGLERSDGVIKVYWR